MGEETKSEKSNFYTKLQARVKKQFELQANRDKKREANRLNREGSNIYYPVIKENDEKQHFACFNDGSVYLIQQSGWRKIKEKDSAK